MRGSSGMYWGEKDGGKEDWGGEGLGEELNRSEDVEELDHGEGGQVKEGGRICVGVGGGDGA